MRSSDALTILLFVILTTGCLANRRALKGSELVTSVASGLAVAPGPTGGASGIEGPAEGPSDAAGGGAGTDGPNPVNGEPGRTCRSDSKNFKGPCFSDHNCKSICLTEGFPGGECTHLVPHCECTKPC